MMQISVDAFSPSERVSRLPSTRSVHQNESTRLVIFGSNAMIIPPELTQFSLFFGAPLSMALIGVNFYSKFNFRTCGRLPLMRSVRQNASTRPVTYGPNVMILLLNYYCSSSSASSFRSSSRGLFVLGGEGGVHLQILF